MLISYFTQGVPALRNRLLIVILCVLVSGCATLDAEQNQPENPDPFEAFNRDVYAFNVDFDKAIGKPVASTYVKYTPVPVRRSIANFFNNLWEPNSIINAVLQGKIHKAASTTARF